MLRVSPKLTRSRSDEEYWLSHCEGFRVRGPNGFSGVVEAVRFEPGSDLPDDLVVCCGRLRLRSLLIPVADVALIVPRQTRLRLRHTPAATAAKHRRGRWQLKSWEPVRGART